MYPLARGARASFRDMQLRAEPLPIPARGVAGEGSFPLEPDAVAGWLARLDPVRSDPDARELLRGLVHSNRLHNDVERRRRTVTLFLPPLRALHERLAETARAQPLPLTRDFERDRALAADLLREESIAFRALLVDADAPLRADARRAMHALARLAELDANAYRAPDPHVLGDAHALYAWANRTGLVADATPDEGLADLGDHYRLILALALADPHRHRARQLPLLIDWLRRECGRLRLDELDPRAAAAANRRAPGRWLVDLRASAGPVPAGAALTGDSPDLLVVDAAPLSGELARLTASPDAGRTSAPGADNLERQSLARLAAALAPPAGRRAARRADDTDAALVFGQRDICAWLLYDDESEPRPPGGAPWRIVDRSVTGLRLVARDLRPGLVQVGELVTVHEIPDADDEPGTGSGVGPGPGSRGGSGGGDAVRRGLLIGIVRRVRAARDGGLDVGVELLARRAMPVTISREDDAGAAPEQALIVACRVGGRNLQTLLVPAYLYRTGDRLRAVRRGRSRRLELARCLQVNGLFSHYVVETPD